MIHEKNLQPSEFPADFVRLLGQSQAADDVEKHYRAALNAEIELQSKRADEAEAKLTRTEAELYAKGQDVVALEADVNKLHRMLEVAEARNDRFLNEIEARSFKNTDDEDTVTFQLTDEERLDLHHLKRRQDAVEGRVEEIREDVSEELGTRGRFLLWSGGAWVVVLLGILLALVTALA